MGIDIMACVLIVVVTLVVVIAKQQKTISNLTDRLMARDFTEYANGTRAREDPPTEMKTRKPQSWYDDPNVDDVE